MSVREADWRLPRTPIGDPARKGLAPGGGGVVLKRKSYDDWSLNAIAINPEYQRISFR